MKRGQQVSRGGWCEREGVKEYDWLNLANSIKEKDKKEMKIKNLLCTSLSLINCVHIWWVPQQLHNLVTFFWLDAEISWKACTPWMVSFFLPVLSSFLCSYFPSPSLFLESHWRLSNPVIPIFLLGFAMIFKRYSGSNLFLFIFLQISRN